MKKLFISCPMKGRSLDEIYNTFEILHKKAEEIFGEKLEVIPTYIEKEAPEDCTNSRIWYLAKSLELLSKADYFIGVDFDGEFIDEDCYPIYSGCEIETITALYYGIKMELVYYHEACPDLVRD